MKRRVFVLFVLVIASCQLVTPDASEPQDSRQSLSFVPVDANGAERETRPLSITVDETPELVFDWTTDRCEDEHIPDIAARAFRDADGMVQLWTGHYVNYRMIGPDLNSVEPDCTVLMRSDYDPDPSTFNDSEWLAAPYTEDGTTIYAIMHNEYRGDTHNDARPGQCPSGDRLTCLDTSVTMAISTDGGDSFHDILEPPNHMVATMPYTFNDQGVPSGLRQPSNIIQGEDGYFYVYTNISDYPERPDDFPPQWVCVMRTDDLSDPSSWRYWNGEGFRGQFVNPYTNPVEPDAPKCAPLDFDDLSGSINETVTYNTALGRYILIGFSVHPTAPEELWGYYYSLSDDLVHWTRRELIFELPDTWRVADLNTDLFYAYPSLIDPASTSMNFETTGENPYLYLTRFNTGISLDRDLVRFPIHVTPPVYPIPTSWRFDTDGDGEGWLPFNDLTSFEVQAGSLSIESTGDDPFIISQEIAVPADEYDRIGIRMKVSDGAAGGQLFFVTDADPEWGEAKSLMFAVDGDGEFHDYVLDMSTVDGWKGVITQMRLDPVWTTGTDIEIDIIAFVE